MKFIAILFALSTVLISACNTIEGVGKDIERGGEKLQDSADSTKKKM